MLVNKIASFSVVMLLMTVSFAGVAAIFARDIHEQVGPS
jgi:hypothetical protein